MDRGTSLDHATPARRPASDVAVTLQRACACGRTAGVTGQCSSCSTSQKLGVQPKLTVSNADNAFEREADRIADQVVSGGPASPTALAVTPLVQRQDQEEEEEETLQSKAASGPGQPAAQQAPDRPNQAAAAVASGGRPLSRAERSFFEPRLGRDLSLVRIHDDARAGAAARGINARAYTLRNHVAFAPGAFDSKSLEGRRLIAHELVHTLQQGNRHTIARKPGKPKSRAALMEMVESPELAHRNWPSMSKGDRTFVLARLKERYANTKNERHNPDWVDEFLTLQENGFRGDDVVNEFRDPAPEMDEDLLFQGFSLANAWTTLGKLNEVWVRPSGKTVILVRDVEAKKPKKQPAPSGPDDDIPELVPDLTQEEIERLLGFKVPHFVMATILSEDEDGNRTIQILQAKEEGGWEEPKVNKVTCSGDDTCNAKRIDFLFE